MPTVMRDVNAYVAGGIALLTIIVFLFDFFADSERGNYPTVSAILLATAQKHPVVPFLLGLLCGHLIWPQS